MLLSRVVKKRNQATKVERVLDVTTDLNHPLPDGLTPACRSSVTVVFNLFRTSCIYYSGHYKQNISSFHKKRNRDQHLLYFSTGR